MSRARDLIRRAICSSVKRTFSTSSRQRGGTDDLDLGRWVLGRVLTLVEAYPVLGNCLEILSEFNAKTPGSKVAKWERGTRSWLAVKRCHQKIVSKQPGRLPENLCAFAPCRLCVKCLLHRSGICQI